MHLGQHKFLAGDQMTFVDVLVFIELETVLIMYKLHTPEGATNLEKWQDEMCKE